MYTLPKTKSLPLKIGRTCQKRSSASNFQPIKFSPAQLLLLLVSVIQGGYVYCYNASRQLLTFCLWKKNRTKTRSTLEQEVITNKGSQETNKSFRHKCYSKTTI